MCLSGTVLPEVTWMNWDGLICFLGTADLQRTHEFYSETLGLKLHKDQGACRIYEIRPGAYVGFCVHHPVKSGPGTLITLLAADVDEVFSSFTRAGVDIETQPALNHEFGIYHFYAHDPNGYRLEVQRFV